MFNELEQNLVGLLECADVPIALIRSERKRNVIYYCNLIFSQLYGYESMYRGVLDRNFVHGIYLYHHNTKHLEFFIENSIDTSLPTLNVDKNGEFFPCLIFLNRIVDRNGSIVGTIECHIKLDIIENDVYFVDIIDQLDEIIKYKMEKKFSGEFSLTSNFMLPQSSVDAAKILFAAYRSDHFDPDLESWSVCGCSLSRLVT